MSWILQDPLYYNVIYGERYR